MPKGGHARSGPAPIPGSGRSDARGLTFTALPSGGYSGPVPDFPLPNMRAREAEVWAWAWTTPQACAWAQPSESWRLLSIAMWVRTFVICEGDEATAADKGSLHRFADDIGMTKQGMRLQGWDVATDEIAQRRSTSRASAEVKPRRLRPADAAQ